MTRSWPARVRLAGLLLAAVPLACMGFANPGRIAARDWPVYGLVLLLPYLLAADGCRTSRFARALASLVVLLGVALAAAAALEVWPVVEGYTPPAVPAAAMLAAGVVPVQNVLGLMALVAGRRR